MTYLAHICSLHYSSISTVVNHMYFQTTNLKIKSWKKTVEEQKQNNKLMKLNT